MRSFFRSASAARATVWVVLALVVAQGGKTVPALCAADKRALPKKDIVTQLTEATAFDLLSLQPVAYSPEDDEKQVTLFHRHRVWGKVEFSDLQVVKQIRDGLSDSLSEDRDIRALCFRPRHGLIVKKKDKVICELLICFECKTLHVYDGEKYRGSISVTRGLDKELDKILTKHKIRVDD